MADEKDLVVNQVVYKAYGEDGSDKVMPTKYSLGGDFENIVDSGTHYSLKQFFDHYINYMKNASFIYCGPNRPYNKHITMWIDTSSSNGL